MATFDTAETSPTSSQPAELYEIATPNVTYRMTSYRTDVSYNGFVWTATSMSRGPHALSQSDAGQDLVLNLPVSHPLVQRYVSVGVPEQTVILTARRLQVSVGVAIQFHYGYVTSMTFADHTVELHVPSLGADAMRITLPVIAAQRTCNHLLFDRQCSPQFPPGSPFPGDGPNAADFTLFVAVISQTPSGTMPAPAVDLVVDSIAGKPNDWATFGEVTNLAATERRMVLKQTGTTITLNAAIPELGPGSGVAVIGGCDHIVGTCDSKFNNHKNFGGHPYMNTGDSPWVPAGLGIKQQA